VFCNCWLRGDLDGTSKVGISKSYFLFINGKCSSFLGKYEAEIVGEISQERKMEGDHAVAASLIALSQTN
jgi:hypothetical protein